MSWDPDPFPGPTVRQLGPVKFVVVRDSGVRQLGIQWSKTLDYNHVVALDLWRRTLCIEFVSRKYCG